MADPWIDPTAAGVFYADPTAPVFIAPIVLPEPDPVYRDDALFASASANWRPAPMPVPPIPVLDESGLLVLVPPTAAMLRDQAVAALKAPPAHYQAPASRGGARSTYTAEPPPRPSRRPGPARPPGSVTTSPSTWLPNTRPTPTAPWRQQPAPPTWLPQPQGQPQRPPVTPPQTGSGGPGPVTYRPAGPTRGTGQPGPSGRRRGSSKGWIPGLVVLAFVILANVVPHLGSVFHRGLPAGVDKSVNSYYTFLERGQTTQAANLICASERADWVRAGPSSDLGRRITGHNITSTNSAGKDAYNVDVTVAAATPTPTPTPASITVVRESGSYRICGGTGP